MERNVAINWSTETVILELENVISIWIVCTQSIIYHPIYSISYLSEHGAANALHKNVNPGYVVCIVNGKYVYIVS